MSAILRNAFTAVKRRELEAQIYAPMPVLSELYFPASSTALPTYNTGYNKRPLRHSQLKGAHSDMPVLSVVFCTSAQMGLPDYSPDGKNSDALNVFLKASRQASDLSFAMVEKLKMQGALARVAYKSEETEAGRIWQLGVSMPVTRPFWNRKGDIQPDPNNDQLAIFNRYLLDHNLITEEQAKPVFSARVRYLAQQL
tara:strand:- start:776981 stop:777571 length:591 start_codon:yes stop_codon:yes gene_type:complete